MRRNFGRIAEKYKYKGVNVLHVTGKPCADGSSCIYFKFRNGKGLKVLNSTLKDLGDFKNTNSWKQAGDEKRRWCKLTFIIPLNVPSYTDRVLVKRNGTFHVGLLVEHIKGATLASKRGLKTQEAAMDFGADLIIDYGLFVRDLHDENIVVRNGTYCIVDFGSSIFLNNKPL